VSWRASLPLLYLLCALATRPAFAQEIRVGKPTPTSVVVTGPGASPWQLRYGSHSSTYFNPLVISIGGDRALFAHGAWLRLIDTKQGVVLGRWRFPSAIERMTRRADGAVDVTIGLAPWMRMPSLTTRFDPAVPRPPVWDVGSLIIFRGAEFEANGLIGGGPWREKHQANPRLIADLEEANRRDPFAPFLRLALAKLLQDADDTRAPAAFENIFAVPSTEFSEWLTISAILDDLPIPLPDLASRAFDRAMTDFIGRDRDPRLMETLIGRLVLYPAGNIVETSNAMRNVYLERIYRIAPMGEGTARAWAFHARALERQGDPASAVWRRRADESGIETLLPYDMVFQMRADQFLLLGIAGVAAAIVLITNRHLKYTPQRRMHAVAAMRSGTPGFGTFRLFGLRYWTRRERWTLVAMLLVTWVALGAAGSYLRILGKGAALPVHVGMVNGLERFEDNYPESPERVLLQALGQYSIGEAAEAEKLYRSVPQFAESWNNLGVIQARSGRTDDSRQSFARALEIDPNLPEAILNTSGDARTPVMEILKQYAPDAKHIAVPSRDRMFTAYMGTRWTRRWAHAWSGPLEAIGSARRVSDLSWSSFLFGPTAIAGLTLLVLLVPALVLIAFVPMEEATVPPGRLHAAVDWVLPGVSAAWGWASTIILIGWSLCAVALGLQLALKSPYLFTRISQTGIMRAFGYYPGRAGVEDLNPPLLGWVAALIALWIANAALLLWRDRRPLR